MSSFFEKLISWSTLASKIIEVRSGGQTGFDEGGIIGADANGINCIVLSPMGWLFRTKDHKDIKSEKLFKERFLNIYQ